MTLIYTVKRGSRIGETLTPHRGSDGQYVASPDRFAASQQRFATAAQATQAAIANGWGIRMSSNGIGPASLIRPELCDNFQSVAQALQSDPN